MLVITSSGVAIAVLLAGMLCEGSWMVPLRYVTEKRKLVSVFLLFYDWKTWTFAFTVVSTSVFGSFGSQQPNIWTNLVHAEPKRVVFAVLGGASTAIGDVFVVYADALCGTALTFPICYSLLFCLGTTLVYFVQPRGSPALLFAGVGVAFLSAVLGGWASWEKTRWQKKEASPEQGLGAYEMKEKPVAPVSVVPAAAATVPELPDRSRPATPQPWNPPAPATQPDASAAAVPLNDRTQTMKGVAFSALGGLVYSAWEPLGTLAQQGNGCATSASFTGLSPHSTWLLFTVGFWLANFPVASLALYFPLVPGVPKINPIRGYFSMLRLSDHMWMAVPGALLWGIYAANWLAGDVVGYAVSFGILESAPVISALWGIFFWHEFRGANWRSKALFVAMMVGFTGSIALIVSAHFARPSPPSPTCI